LIAGTDFPYDMEESQIVDFVHRAGLNTADTQAILGLNAARLLGIDPQDAMLRARAAAVSGSSSA
jgi:predicted TIM-barrel fold metal-dependent hydrolase